MLKKLLIIPYFGQFPEWMDKWLANMEYLREHGYDYLLYTNLELFEERVRECLGIEPSIKYGTGKAWDYRPALATLFAKDVKGYDYWGHTDLDCVYGDVSKFIPDKELKKWEIWTNGTYITGPWTLYKNCKKVNEVFKLCDNWQRRMESPIASGWIEYEYNEAVKKNLKVNYCLQQTKDWDNFDTLTFNDGKLFEGDKEVFLAHFRRTKQWPTHITL